MAFLKKAYAAVTHANWGPANWQRFVENHRNQMAATGYRGLARTASGAPNLVAQASEILKDDFSPEKYLLTHATIVASVDTEDVANVKLGNVSEMGKQVNRRWANYRVLPKCDQFINNNHDAWDRPVLLKSYRTFVGAHNFVEHVQIEEQSKGRIIDAAARDIGDSIYVDILVATNRKHASLINDIQNGRMSTMSMGCSVTETICTKCGNVAADETQMCDHVKYAKGNYEFDTQGRKYRVAELCGHDDLDPTGGVNFIEASWVGIPAFQGAVMRNILTPDNLSNATHDQVRSVLASPPREWTADDIGKVARESNLAEALSNGKTASGSPYIILDPNSKTAHELAEERRLQRQAEFAPMPGAPAEDEGGGLPGMPAPGGEGEEEKSPLDDLEGQVQKYILDKVKKKLREQMQGDEDEDAPSDPELATSTNENINHQAAKKVASGTAALLRIARSDVELLDGVARLEESHGLQVSRDLYRSVLRVGSTEGHQSLEKYLSRCAEVLGRTPTTGEAKTLVRLGRILSMRKKTRF